MWECAAGQHKTLCFFFGAQCLTLVITVGNRTRDLFAFAGAAGAVFAPIGQANALADSGGQDGFVRFSGKGAPTGLHQDRINAGGGGSGAHLVGILGAQHLNEAAILPSNQSPLGALPARFRRERVLIVGCGDVGVRVAQQLHGKVRMLALTSSADRRVALRTLGVTPLMGNLDAPQSLRRLAAIATRVLHLAPPASHGNEDARTLALARVLRLRMAPKCLVYGSTSGVYGDCGGAVVTETRAVRPATERAQRRVSAEAVVRFLGRATQIRASILRIPGIYAPDRAGGTPHARLVKATPVQRPEDDVYTNHIHANDLARACQLALWRASPQRVYNVSDDSDLKMGDYFDLAADLYGLQRPPRVTRAQATAALSPMQRSFMEESRRLDNTRMKRELRLRLRHPTVQTGLL